MPYIDLTSFTFSPGFTVQVRADPYTIVRNEILLMPLHQDLAIHKSFYIIIILNLYRKGVMARIAEILQCRRNFTSRLLQPRYGYMQKDYCACKPDATGEKSRDPFS